MFYSFHKYSIVQNHVFFFTMIFKLAEENINAAESLCIHFLIDCLLLLKCFPFNLVSWVTGLRLDLYIR